MRIRFAVTATAGLFALVGCGDDNSGGTAVTLQEAAIVRYVNAVPDTSALDFRFIDGSVEGSPQWMNTPFRTFTPYQRVRPGLRQIRIFTNPIPYALDAAVAQQQHLDTTFTFEANARYTVISYGFSRTGQLPRHRLVILRDELPTLTASQVGVRTIHAAPGVGNVDVYVQVSEAPAGVTGAPAAANVAPLGLTAYIALLARPAGGALSYRWNVTTPGSTVALPFGDNTGLLGRVGTPAANPLAGFQVGRTVVTAIVFAPSVTGSRAASFATAGMRFLPDKALDSTEP